MVEEKIPVDVRSFIMSHIRSVAHLELLIFLYNHPAKSWKAEELCHELRTNKTLVLQVIKEFEDSACIQSDSADTYRIANSGDRETLRIVQLIAQLYQSHRYAIIEEIYKQQRSE